MQSEGNIFWGINDINNSQRHLNKKRKYEDSIRNDEERKYEVYDPLIYTLGKTVYFSSEIKKITIEILIKHIGVIIEEFHEEYKAKGEELLITYIVDSPGGSVTSVLKFVDYISMAKKNYQMVKFKSVISGLAASAGTIMACVADKREITKYAKAMIHDLSTQNGGSYTQLMAHSEFLKDLNDTLIDIYHLHCNRSKEELAELLKSNKWFNSKQYLEFGFVDSILESNA